MDKELVLQMSKKDMNRVINGITITNIREMKLEILHYFDFLEQLAQLSDNFTEIKNESSPETALAFEKESQEERKEINDERQPLLNTSQATIQYEETPEIKSNQDNQINEELPPKSYLVERKLRGAYCPEINVYIPEGIVRKLDISHHDYVYVEKIEENRYWYSVAKKGDGKDPIDRIELNYCIVEKDGSMLVTKRTVVDGDIRIDEVPYTFLLNEKDVRDMEIQEGDIIDIAFYKGFPENHKIIWKQIDFKEDCIELEQKKNESERNHRKAKIKTESEEIPLSLKGKAVLVIGNEPRKDLYQASIEERGGTFLWADAKDDFIRLESLVRKSDIVVFLLKVSGHIGMKQVKTLCKQYGVPFLTTFSNGKTSLVKMAEEATLTINA